VEGVITSVEDSADDLDVYLSSLQALMAEIEAFIGPDGTSSELDSLLSDVRSYQSAAVDASNSVDQSAKTIQSTSSITKLATQEAQGSSSDLRAKVGGIAIGSPDQLSATTKTELTGFLDALDDSLNEALAMASTGTVVQQQTQQIVSSIGSVKDQLSLIKTRVDSIDEVLVKADGKAVDVAAQHNLIAAEADELRDHATVLSTQIISPWDESTSRMDALWTHLDGVFSGA
jgi:hypothetical protein